MNKALLLLVVIFAVLSSAQAQWYTKSCNVADLNACSNEEFECLWNKASKITRVGSISTVVGTSLVATGILTSAFSSSETGAWTGVFIATSGVIIDALAIPVWIVGGFRKGELKKMPHYQNMHLESLKISPSINWNHSNNSYAPGLSASLRF